MNPASLDVFENSIYWTGNLGTPNAQLYEMNKFGNGAPKAIVKSNSTNVKVIDKFKQIDVRPDDDIGSRRL